MNDRIHIFFVSLCVDFCVIYIICLLAFVSISQRLFKLELLSSCERERAVRMGCDQVNCLCVLRGNKMEAVERFERCINGNRWSFTDTNTFRFIFTRRLNRIKCRSKNVWAAASPPPPSFPHFSSKMLCVDLVHGAVLPYMTNDWLKVLHVLSLPSILIYFYRIIIWFSSSSLLYLVFFFVFF